MFKLIIRLVLYSSCASFLQSLGIRTLYSILYSLIRNNNNKEIRKITTRASVVWNTSGLHILSVGKCHLVWLKARSRAHLNHSCANFVFYGSQGHGKYSGSQTCCCSLVQANDSLVIIYVLHWRRKLVYLRWRFVTFVCPWVCCICILKVPINFIRNMVNWK